MPPFVRLFDNNLANNELASWHCYNSVVVTPNNAGCSLEAENNQSSTAAESNYVNICWRIGLYVLVLVIRTSNKRYSSDPGLTRIYKAVLTYTTERRNETVKTRQQIESCEMRVLRRTINKARRDRAAELRLFVYGSTNRKKKDRTERAHIHEGKW